MVCYGIRYFFFFNDTATTEIYTLSLHDALPICLDNPDFEATKRPDYVPPEGARAQDAIGGADPFVMQGDGKAWLFAPAGVVDGPLPTHYEPAESVVENALYKQQANPTLEHIEGPWNRENPPLSDVFPFQVTTYRLTEHHTAGGMSRTLPYLSELQPEFFVEVSPELAELRGLTNGEYATLVSSRTAIEAKVLVTERIRPIRLDRKSTRLNSSHANISYAVFCLKKK